MRALVTAPTCSYCYQPKGVMHASFCTRPGRKREDEAAHNAAAIAALSAPRCPSCGLLLVSGRCASDWCPSTATERKATAALESVVTGVAFGVRWAWLAGRAFVVAVLIIVVFRVMGWVDGWPAP